MIGVLHIVLGSICIAANWELGWVGAPVIWFGLSVVVAGLAYLLGTPAPFGKRADGSVQPLALLVIAPYRWLAWAAWLRRRRRHPEACQAIATLGDATIWLGRRALASELPDDTKLIVDLPCELPPSRHPTAIVRCLPTLDGRPPAIEGMAALVDELLATDGPAFVHCAAGRGRSATLVAAALIRAGRCADAAEAVILMREHRPEVAITKAQADAAERAAHS